MCIFDGPRLKILWDHYRRVISESASILGENSQERLSFLQRLHNDVSETIWGLRVDRWTVESFLQATPGHPWSAVLAHNGIPTLKVEPNPSGDWSFYHYSTLPGVAFEESVAFMEYTRAWLTRIDSQKVISEKLAETVWVDEAIREYRMTGAGPTSMELIPIEPLPVPNMIQYEDIKLILAEVEAALMEQLKLPPSCLEGAPADKEGQLSLKQFPEGYVIPPPEKGNNTWHLVAGEVRDRYQSWTVFRKGIPAFTFWMHQERLDYSVAWVNDAEVRRQYTDFILYLHELGFKGLCNWMKAQTPPKQSSGSFREMLTDVN